MRIHLGKIRQSPFVGVFAMANEKMCFVPRGIDRKEEKMVKGLFGCEILRMSVADSSLIGVLAIANSRGIAVGEIAEEAEIEEMRKAGLRVEKIKNLTAIGNLVAVNDSRGTCSSTLGREQRKQIEGALGVELLQATIAGSDLVGAALVATNKGFAVNKAITEQELGRIEKHFGLQGALGTANSGDTFLGNSVIANTSAALAGIHTTGHELSRLDDGLSGR